MEGAEPSPAAPTAAGAAGVREPGHLCPGLRRPELPARPTWPRARSPRFRWLPHPTAPAPVLRGRPGSRCSSGSGWGRRAAARPPPGTGRPAPPRRRTRPAAAAPTANHRAEGAGPVAHQTRPIQPVPRAGEKPRSSTGDWSGLLKGLRRRRLEKRGGQELLHPRRPSYLAESKCEEPEFLSPYETEARSPVLFVS